MSGSSRDIAGRAEAYANARGINLKRMLGFGREAKVYLTSAGTAIKVHEDPEGFQCELLCYIRLMSREIWEVLGHNVPKLLDADERLLVLELTVVERPFLLDFGAARLDSAPIFRRTFWKSGSRRRWSSLGRTGRRRRPLWSGCGGIWGFICWMCIRGTSDFESGMVDGAAAPHVQVGKPAPQ
jgi:hypothetical protein